MLALTGLIINKKTRGLKLRQMNNTRLHSLYIKSLMCVYFIIEIMYYAHAVDAEYTGKQKKHCQSKLSAS